MEGESIVVEDFMRAEEEASETCAKITNKKKLKELQKEFNAKELFQQFILK